MRRGRFWWVLLVTLLLAGCRDRLMTSAGVNPDHVVAIERAIGELRGQPFVPSARIEIVDPPAMAATLTRLREGDDSLRILEQWSEIDRAFGDPWPVTPRAAARQLPTDSTFGVYSPADDVLFLARARLPTSGPIAFVDFLSHGDELAEIVVTHELVHAWQQRHLPALFEPTADIDHFATQRALREGDAEVTSLALTRGTIDEPALRAYLEFRSQMARAAGQYIDSRDWQLRYRYATEYVAAAVRRDGWAAWGGALRDPPRATAVLLQPDEFPDAGRGLQPLPAPIACQPGERLTVDTAIGSLNSRPLLRIEPATIFGLDGWRGDRLRLCTAEGSDAVTLRWITRWHDERAAQFFFRAARAHLLRHHPGADAADDADRCSVSAASWVVRRDQTVELADRQAPVLPN